MSHGKTHGEAARKDLLDFERLRMLVTGLPDSVRSVGERAAFAPVHDELERLSTSAQGGPESWCTSEMARFRREVLPLLQQSTFVSYSLTKPRGYPGDYVTQEMMWLGQSPDSPFRYAGATDVGRFFSACAMDMAAPKANKHRMLLLRQWIASYGPRVASIGAGSCIELWDPIDDTPREILLLDQDQEALHRARSKIERHGTRCVCHREDVRRMLLRPDFEWLGRPDLVYSFGLLDYLAPRVAQRLVRTLWPSVADGGALIVTNAHPGNPTRLWMEWGLDWHLDYKAGDVMRGLSEGLPGVASVNISTDPFGVYQYLEIQKTGS